MGVAVPVIYQRADGSAHVIAAVHSGYRDGRGVVDLLDPQKGEVAEKADVSAVAGMWVIPVSEVAPDREVVLPPGGSGLRSMGWGAGLPAEVAGPKRQSGVSGPVAGEAGTKGTKRTREEAGESSSGASKRRKVTGTVGVDSGNQGGGEPAPQEQVELNERRQARDRAAKVAAVGEIANLEALEGQGRLNPEQQDELDLRRGIAADIREEERLKARVRRAKGSAAEIEALQQPTEAEQGRLPALRRKVADSVAQLTETRRNLAEKKKKLKLIQEAESAPTGYRGRKGTIARVAELKRREELTGEEAEELARLEPEVAEWKRKKAENAVNLREPKKAAAARVAELEGREELTGEETEELAKLQPKVAKRKEQTQKNNQTYRKAINAEADRVAELQGREELTEEQAEELARLQPRVAKRKEQSQKNKQTYRKAINAEADRVAELQGREELTGEQAEELARLQPRVAKRKEPTQQKERDAERYRARKGAIDRVAELKGREELTGEEAEELANLEPEVAEWKRQKAEIAGNYRKAKKAAAARVAELEGREELTREEAEELAKLRSKVAKQKQQTKKNGEKPRETRKDAAAEIAKLEELAKQGPLTSEQQAELDLRREIEKEKKEENRLNTRASRVRKWSAEIEALEALPRSAANEAKLSTLQDNVYRSAGSVEELAETRRRLAEKKEKLKSMKARGRLGRGGLRRQVGSRTSRMQWCRAGYRSRLGLIGTNKMKGTSGRMGALISGRRLMR